MDDQLLRLYRSAEAAASEGLVEEVIKRCRSAMDILDLNPDEDGQFQYSDFLMLAGHACFEEGYLEDAQRYYHQAYNAEPGRLEAVVAMGVTLFFLCRFEASRHWLEMSSVEDPDVGEVWYYLALLALRRNERPLADLYFERANEMEPERWLKPLFLPIEDIEKMVNEIFDQLPLEIRTAISNVPIILEERPDEAFLHASEPPLDPLLLGFFEGVAMPDQSVFDAPADTARILLFAENIALIAEDEDRLYEELGITMKHEIGHFLGLDEDDLAERGLD